MALLALSNVRASYGKLAVLRGVDLAIEPGQVHLLIGRNGSGKSTTLRVIAGLLPLTGGDILFEGKSFGAMTIRRRVESGVVFVPQAGNNGRAIFPHLRVIENLELTAPDNDASRYTDVWSLFPELAPVKHKRAGMLSGGQQQMLAVGMALMTRPKLLMLDEPTCGVARGRALQLMQTVRALARDRGLAVLLVEQNVSLTLKAVDTISALRAGQVVASAPPSALDDPAWLSQIL